MRGKFLKAYLGIPHGAPGPDARPGGWGLLGRVVGCDGVGLLLDLLIPKQ